LAAIVMTKPQKPWRRLIPDRLVNRFATRNICQAGYGPRRGRRPKKSTPIDNPWSRPICGAGVDKHNLKSIQIAAVQHFC
jgi:hypothetical protein